MTPQEFFDKTVAGIRAQGEPSVDEDGCCCYRGPGGLKCAAGLHITDEEYRRGMEGNRVGTLIENCMLLPSHVLAQHRALARQMQSAHDNASDDSNPEGVGFLRAFEVRVRDVAASFGLIYTAP